MTITTATPNRESARRYGADLEQARFLGARMVDQLADPLHEIATLAGSHELDCAPRLAGVMKTDRLLHFGELPRDRDLEFGQKSALSSVVPRRFHEVRQHAGSGLRSAFVRTEIVGVAGEKVSTLPALGCTNRRLQICKLARDLERVAHPERVALRPNDQYGRNQAGHHQDDEACRDERQVVQRERPPPRVWGRQGA
jgi:hypothetical protein